MHDLDIMVGACYSNGDFGRNWCVWQVVDTRMRAAEGVDPPGMEQIIRYKVLVGAARRKNFECTRQVFVEKMRYQVELHENSWQKVK